MTTALSRQSPVARRRHAPPLALAALLLLTACYVGGPFVTLWRIGRALHSGDLAVLRGAIDWNAVRQGLKDDIAEGVLGMPPQALVASNTLPPFGANFISAVAATLVDRDVTPQGLLWATHLLDPRPDSAPFPTIVDAGFASPLQFDLRVRIRCQDVGEPPLHLRLAFRTGVWRLVRVWVPQDLMDRAAAPA